MKKVAHLWSIMCRNSIVDGETNNLSLLNIIEELRITTERVEMLADRPEGFRPENAVPFRNLIPLSEVIAGTIGEKVESKKVWEEYNKLISKFGSELNVLLYSGEEELKRIISDKIANNILKNRKQRIPFRPGYDGVYGVPIFEEGNEKPHEDTGSNTKQGSLARYL